MRAWRVHELGNPDDVLTLEDVEQPAPGPGQVLVKVRAAALNFFEAHTCEKLRYIGKREERFKIVLASLLFKQFARKVMPALYRCRPRLSSHSLISVQITACPMSGAERAACKAMGREC